MELGGAVEEEQGWRPLNTGADTGHVLSLRDGVFMTLEVM